MQQTVDCRVCLRQFPKTPEFFYQQTESTLKKECKECTKKASKAWKQRNRERVNAKERVRQRPGEGGQYRHLSQEERELIASKKGEMTQGQIAARIGRSRSTISRELARQEKQACESTKQ